MAGTTEIRRKAAQKRREIGLPPEQQATADMVLAALEAATGITCYPVPPDDPLLCGAQAVLNLPMQCIFQEDSRPDAARRFDAAHEYAHVFLHEGTCHCAAADLADTTLTDPAPIGTDAVEGYSPRQKREAEANTYAAELLLPGTLLRHLFFQQGLSACQIADAVGVAPSLALAQMTETLLLPPLSDAPPAAPTPAAQAVALDPFQRAAAECAAGPLLLGAGPGTGKTKTLVGRCRYLAAQGVPPEKILCLTFSRDAAQEMRERLAAAGIGAGGAGPWVGTFHSFGMDVLRRYGARIGVDKDARLLGTLDALTLLENNLPLLALDALDNLYNPAVHLRAILRQISRAKDELCSPARYQQLCEAMQHSAQEAAAVLAAKPGKVLKRDQEAVERALLQAAKALEVARCYPLYEQLKAEHGLLDYGDLLARSVEVMETCPDALAAMQAEYPHVLADEYQDVNRACARLVRLLAGDTAAGLWAVGDHRQSIYRFRGASPANVASFGSDYPHGQCLELGVNYRSHEPIVQCFGAVAAAITAEQDGFTIWQAQRGAARLAQSDAAVTVATAPDDRAQAAGIAARIHALRPSYPYREQAILCRTHAQARDLVELLTAEGVPVLYLGDLMERTEVKDLLCVLSLFAPRIGAGLLRAAALPEYNVPQKDTLLFLARARAAETTLVQSLQDPALRDDLSDAGAAGLARLGAHLAELDTLDNDPAALLRHYLFNQSAYLRHLESSDLAPFERQQQRLAVHGLYALTLAFDRRIVAPSGVSGPPNRTQEFLAHLQRQAAAGESAQGTVPEGAEDADAVRIMTAHKAKGLEYPVVFVPNLGRGQFPGKGRSDGLAEPPGLADTPEEDGSEDEYLFFVALSRARDRLILSRATQSRSDKEIAPSPLLALLDNWLLAHPEARAEWPPAPAAPAIETADPPADTLPLFTASALELYARCPRLYYYEREMKLPGTLQQSGYPQFHDCVRRVLAWQEEEHAAGRLVTATALEALLGETWAQHGPVGHLHEEKYKHSARQMLAAAQTLGAGHTPQPRPYLTATLAHCRVTVRPDAAHRRMSDNALVYIRRLTGRPGDDDLRAPKLALLRRAASALPEPPPVLELHYLAEAQKTEVPAPATDYKAKLEADRLQKYDRAARGLRLRLFPPTPAAADECQSCPYALVCPL